MNTAQMEATPTASTLAFTIEKDEPGSLGMTDLPSLWQTSAKEIDGILRSKGAILFRGYGINDQKTFESLISSLKESLLDYVDGNSPRTKVGGGVYTSTEYPAEYFISLHNELSYSASWPGRIFFCCVQAPFLGGETPLVDSRRLLQELPTYLVDAFREGKVRYTRNLHAGRGFGPSWQKTFQTEDKEEAGQIAQGTGVEVEWFADDTMRLSAVRPATYFHPITGEEVWFNQADQFHPSTHPDAMHRTIVTLYKGREGMMPQNATFANGSPIPLEYFTIIREKTRQLLTTFKWQHGDVLMADNVLVAHGRMPFSGPRRVLVAMTSR